MFPFSRACIHQWSSRKGDEESKLSTTPPFIDDLSPLFINPVMPVQTQCCVTHFEGLISPMWLKGFIAGVTRLERKQGCEMHVVLK